MTVTDVEVYINGNFIERVDRGEKIEDVIELHGLSINDIYTMNKEIAFKFRHIGYYYGRGLIVFCKVCGEGMDMKIKVTQQTHI